MFKPTILASLVIALTLISQLDRSYVSSAEQAASSTPSNDVTTTCEKVIASLAKIAQNMEDDEEIRLSAIQGMVDIHNSSGDASVECQVVDSLLQVFENREETAKIRGAALQALLDLVQQTYG